MLEAILLVSALLCGYVVYSIIDRNTLFDRNAFPTLFRGLEVHSGKRPFRLVVRFQNSPYWFLYERTVVAGKESFALCIPRPGFSEQDFESLQSTYTAHSFEFRRGEEMSRFFAIIPVDDQSRHGSTSTAAAHAARLFIQALNIDINTKFRRSYDAD